MNKEIIRKNIVSNQWEHYIPETNYSKSYWAQGVIANKNLKITNTPNQLPIYKDDVLLSYGSVLYTNEQFELSYIKKTQKQDFIELNVTTLAK